MWEGDAAVSSSPPRAPARDKFRDKRKGPD
jgi:hypothetical protein